MAPGEPERFTAAYAAPRAVRRVSLGDQLLVRQHLMAGMRAIPDARLREFTRRADQLAELASTPGMAVDAG